MDRLGAQNFVRIFVRVETSKRTTFRFRTIRTSGKKKISSALTTYCGYSIKRQKILSAGQSFGQLLGQARGTGSDRISDISLSKRDAECPGGWRDKIGQPLALAERSIMAGRRLRPDETN
jgi:hypothetical protein